MHNRMMQDTPSSPTIPVSQNLEIRGPGPEGGIIVLDSDWSLLKHTIERISPGSRWYRDAGFMLIGISVTCFLSALSLPDTAEVFNISGILLSWALCISSLFCSILSLFFSKEHKVMTERTKQDALVEMNRIKGRCTPKASNELTTLMEKTSQYFEKRLGELQKQAIELGINPDPQNESILDTHGTKSESDKL